MPWAIKPLTKEQIQTHLDHMCCVKGCPYYTMAGYIYCSLHLNGIPDKAPKEVVAEKLRREVAGEAVYS